MVLRLFVLFVTACGGTADTTIDITHDPCAGVTLDGGSTEIQQGGIAGAIALWSASGLSLPNGAEIPVLFERASQAFRGVYDDERGIIHINDGIEELAPLSIVIAHELGHAFGLEHVTDRPSLMNPANLTQAPTDEDRLAVEALWGACQ